MEEELVPLKVGFDVTLRGFDRNQVMQYLQEVQEEIRVLSTDRNSAMSQTDAVSKQLHNARAEIESLRRKCDELSKAPMSAADLGDRLNRMITLSNNEAEEITARAQGNAANIRATAEQDARALRERYQKMLAELDAQREELIAEHKKTMAAAHSQIAQLEHESQTRRTKAEDEHTESVRSREATFAKEHNEREMSSKREAEKRVREATNEATKRVREATEEAQKRVREATAEAEKRVRIGTAEAEKRVTEATNSAKRMIDEATAKVTSLQQLRAKIGSQLGTALNLLHEAEPNLAKVDEEDKTLRENSAPVEQNANGAPQPEKKDTSSQEKTRQLPKPRPTAAARK